MKSYLLVWFNSEGGRPSEVTQRLLSLGFQPMRGTHDYVYDWGRKVSVEEALSLGDKVQMTLRGMNVMFKLETVDGL